MEDDFTVQRLYKQNKVQQKQIKQLKEDVEKIKLSLWQAHRMLDHVDCPNKCSREAVALMPYGDSEPCGWCIAKSRIKQDLKGA